MEANATRAQRDVRLVMERARFVLNILDDETVEIIQNERFSLHVIAIVGRDYDGEVLLEEIGLFRTSPFRPSQIGRTGRKKGKSGRRKCCPARGKGGSITDEQYQLVAPTVFRILQQIVNEQSAKWKRGLESQYRTRTPVIKRNSSGKIYISRVELKWQRGLRFSVRSESRFAQDVCWAEFNLNTDIENYVKLFAGSSTACLSGYNVMSLHSKNFCKLKGYNLINKVITASKIPRHLLIETFEHLPPLNHFFNQLADFVGWDRAETEEKRLSLRTLADPRSRLREIQVRIIRNKGEFLTFEVFPKT